MKLIDNLLYAIRQLTVSADELQETVNVNDRQTRLKELRGYHRLAGQVLEKLENECYRRDPKFAAQRAVLRKHGSLGNDKCED